MYGKRSWRVSQTCTDALHLSTRLRCSVLVCFVCELAALTLALLTRLPSIYIALGLIHFVPEPPLHGNAGKARVVQVGQAGAMGFCASTSRWRLDL